MANDVVITLSGQEADLIRSFQRSNDELRDIVKGLAETEAKSRKVGQTNKTIWGESGKAALAFGGVLAGISSAQDVLFAGIRQIRREFETLEKFQRKAADRNIVLAEAKERALLNLGDVPAADQRRFTQGIGQISKISNVDEALLFDVGGEGLSASGGDIDRTLEATFAASRLAPNNPAILRALAGGALDISKVSGAGAEANLGFLLGLGEQSRVVDPALLGRNAAPAVAGATQTGADLRTAAAFFATISQGSIDTQGARSGTATTNFFIKLEEFLPELDTAIERLRTLQADPALGKEFFEGLGGEIKAKPFIRSILEGSEFANLFDRALEKIPAIAEGEGVFNRRVAALGRDPSLQLARGRREAETTAQNLLGGNLLAAEAGEARDAVVGILQAQGKSDLAQRLGRLNFEAASRAGTAQPFETAAGILQRERKDLLRTEDTLPFIPTDAGVGFVPPPSRVPRTPSAEDRRQAELLADAIQTFVDVAAKLDKLGNSLENNTQSTERNTQAGDRRDATRPETRAPEQDRTN